MTKKKVSLKIEKYSINRFSELKKIAQNHLQKLYVK